MSDSDNDRIQKFAAGGNDLTEWSTTFAYSLDNPMDAAVSSTGVVYVTDCVTDHDHHVVRAFGTMPFSLAAGHDTVPSGQKMELRTFAGCPDQPALLLSPRSTGSRSPFWQ